ncbi:MAG: Chemotaxis protein CheY, partial [Solirubrobacterales bacterium]|nr:Chemotaxis protein CheY [Solirubrobacterales bacterium]
TLLLYTDGVLEAGPAGQQLGEDGLFELARAAPGMGLDGLLEHLVRGASSRADDRLRDDIALIALRLSTS